MDTLPATESPRTFDALSPQSKVRLLHMSFDRVVFSVNAIPIVGLILLVGLLLESARWQPLLLWAAAYTMAGALMWWAKRRFMAEQASLLEPQQVYERWLARLNRIALIHGFALAQSVWLVGLWASYVLIVLTFISLAGILAANASHQSPVLSSFNRFFASCWSTAVLLMALVTPSHWQVYLLLGLIYAVALHRHAVVAHRFFVQQALLEEESKELAERYKKARDEAEHALAEKNRFLSTASHDLRQPIQAMSFLVDALAGHNRDARLDATVQDLRSAVESVRLMVDSLLDLTHIESGSQPFQLVATDLSAGTAAVVRLFNGEARARGLRLKLRQPPAACWAMVDPLLFQRSLANLLHNALRYTLSGGVLVAIRARGAMWHVEVWDTGIGIAMDAHARIYSPFYREEYAWHVDQTGHGLGLTVVERCARLMGTGYGLKSVPGKGSRFWLELPRCAPASPQARPETALPQPLQPSPPESPQGPLRGRCLLVEDDPGVVSAWRQLLGAWGIELQCAAGAAEALAILETGFEPQVILCDQRLRSAESGFELLQSLLERYPDARGAIVSGELHSPQLEAAQQEGYLVLRKPVDPALLWRLMQVWLA